MISRIAEFYHFNPSIQKLKVFMKTSRATAWLVPIVRNQIYALRNRAHSKVVESGSLKDRFSIIYKYNLWADNESVSGEGSNLSYTVKIRDSLPRILKTYDIQSVVDAPCGDFNWMRFVLSDLDIQYTGVDIVEDLIAKNNLAYATDKIRFKTGDICENRLPSCDLLMTRDCLFHLSFHDIDRYLRNIARVDYKYLLTTSHLTGAGFFNTDIRSGDFRQINLLQAPFSIGEGAVLEKLEDAPDGHPMPRVMMLVAKQDVPTALRL